jgi:hypothetical protein
MPTSQSLSTLQVIVHAPAVHRNGEQFVRPGARQVPRPSQVAAVLRRVPEQTGAAHCVSTGYRAQPPTPSHLPFVPQLAGPLSVQSPFGSGRSASMGQQLPSREGNAQETQGPWHATLQQTLLAQNPDRQSSLVAHLDPFSTLPHRPLLSQAWVPTHWLLDVHFE